MSLTKKCEHTDFTFPYHKQDWNVPFQVLDFFGDFVQFFTGGGCFTPEIREAAHFLKTQHRMSLNFSTLFHLPGLRTGEMLTDAQRWRCASELCYFSWRSWVEFAATAAPLQQTSQARPALQLNQRPQTQRVQFCLCQFWTKQQKSRPPIRLAQTKSKQTRRRHHYGYKQADKCLMHLRHQGMCPEWCLKSTSPPQLRQQTSSNPQHHQTR